MSSPQITCSRCVVNFLSIVYVTLCTVSIDATRRMERLCINSRGVCVILSNRNMLRNITLLDLMPILTIAFIWRNDPMLYQTLYFSDKPYLVNRYIHHRAELEKLGKIYTPGEHLTRSMYYDKSTI